MSDIAVQREISRIDSPPIGPLLSESHLRSPTHSFWYLGLYWSRVFLCRHSYPTRFKGLAGRCRAPSKVLEERKRGG